MTTDETTTQEAEQVDPTKPFAHFVKQNMTKSQAELARELSVNRSTVNLWVLGKRIPNGHQKEKISRCSLFKGDNRKDEERLISVLLMCHSQEVLCTKQ